MDDLEEDLASRLHGRSERVIPAEDLPARIRARVDRHQRRRRLLMGSIPTAGLLAGALIFAAVVAPGGRAPSSSSSAASSVPPPAATPKRAGASSPGPVQSSGSEHGAPAGQPSTTGGQSAIAPAPGGRGWTTVDYGDGQVSVPSGSIVASSACPDPSVPVTVFLGGRPSGVFNCPLEPTGLTTVTLEALPTGTSTSGLRSVTVDGVKVFQEPGDLTTGGYLAPSLGVKVQADGPLASQILGTLSRSPRAAALAGGRAPAVPGSWRAVTFGGLRVSVPATWAVQHIAYWVSPCRGRPPSVLQPLGGSGQPAATLAAGKYLPAMVACPAVIPPTAVPQPTDGLVIDPGPAGPLSDVTSYGPCKSIAGLRVCPARDDPYAELVLRVRTSAGKTVAVVVGLAGNGGTARTILYSLRPT